MTRYFRTIKYLNRRSSSWGLLNLSWCWGCRHLLVLAQVFGNHYGLYGEWPSLPAITSTAQRLHKKLQRFPHPLSRPLHCGRAYRVGYKYDPTSQWQWDDAFEWFWLWRPWDLEVPQTPYPHHCPGFLCECTARWEHDQNLVTLIFKIEIGVFYPCIYLAVLAVVIDNLLWAFYFNHHVLVAFGSTHVCLSS